MNQPVLIRELGDATVLPALLTGDTLYETVLLRNRRLVLLGPHLQRMSRGCLLTQLRVDPAGDGMREAIRAALAGSQLADGSLRITLLRGEADHDFVHLALRPPPPRIVPSLYEQGCAVVLSSIPRMCAGPWRPAVKSGSRHDGALAMLAARQAGAFEALQCDGPGRIVEGVTSNVFAVVDGGLVTPPCADGILDGVTRGVVLELARASGIAVREQSLLPIRFKEAEEWFLTSTLKGVMPVATLDGLPPRSPAPGPVTRALMAKYAAYLETSP